MEVGAKAKAVWDERVCKEMGKAERMNELRQGKGMEGWGRGHGRQKKAWRRGGRSGGACEGKTGPPKTRPSGAILQLR